MKHIFYDCIWRNEDLGFFCVVVCKNPSGWEWLHCPILRRLFEAWRVGERFLFALWWSRTEIFGLLWSRIWTRCSLDISYFLDPLTKELASVSKQVICARCSSQWEYPKLVLIPPDSGSDENIRSRSTHWRATCSFNQVKAIDYRDYIRGKFSDLDIMAFSGKGVCFPVEYVDIRGSTAGKGTTLPFFQGQDHEFLHTDSTFTGCEFKPNVSSAVASEDNFGLYSDVNVKFRCTAGDYSTTQWWFGGYLTK